MANNEDRDVFSRVAKQWDFSGTNLLTATT